MINYLIIPYLYYEYKKFIHASQNPLETQYTNLRTIIQKNKNSDFGRSHSFNKIKNYNDFINFVKIRKFDYFQPYINKICSGEKNVLTSERVLLFEPTSGSIQASKLIPYTKSLQNDFKKGIYPWLYNLYSQNLDLLKGKSYWSVSPSLPYEGKCKIPIGFQKDSEYLGILSKIFEYNMVVPSVVSQIKDINRWKKITCLYLLKEDNLTLISIWNPQFMVILFDYIIKNKEILLNDLETKKYKINCSVKRLQYLRKIFKKTTILLDDIWPNLKMISCWGDAYAKISLDILKRICNNLEVQPKGLIMTEAFISFPIYPINKSVISVRSHFFEFKSLSNNKIYLLNELEKNKQYIVIVTTSGGLYRYNTDDIIEVIGFYNKLPLIKFLGRNNVIDFLGEKLNEQFILKILKKYLLDKYKINFICFTPCFKSKFHYRIYVDSKDKIDSDISNLIEKSLCENYYYKHAKEIGQISNLKIIVNSNNNTYNKYIKYMNKKIKLGDIKPTIISSDINLYKFLEG